MSVADRAIEAINAAIERIKELERLTAYLQSENNRLLERAMRAEDALKASRLGADFSEVGDNE